MIENAGIDYKELYLQMQSAVVALSKTLEEIQKENKNLKEENEWLNRYIGDMLIYSTLMMSI